jgi:hypothetical protein
VTVSWFVPQNQKGFGLSVVPQNQRREVGAGHTSISSGLLGVKARLIRVSQSGLKTDGGVTTGGVAPSRRLRQRQVEDGLVDAMDCVGPCYPTFVIFNVLDSRGIVDITLLLEPIYKTRGLELFTTSQFYFIFPRVEVC